MNDFKFAPGLAGYGTQGVDGSAGTSALGFYFSELNGDESRSTIESKIVNNKILFSSVDELLPGYPDRVYQVGDIFIDKNGKVFKITDPTTGDYENTGAEINTSGLFIQGVTEGAFTRWANDFVTQKVIIDNVLSTNPISDYTATPTTNYNIGTAAFMAVKYSDLSPVDSDYIPFDIFTSGEGENDSIAIVKNSNANIFRIGNLDPSDNVRDTHLIFDGSTVKVSKDKGSTYNHCTESGNLITNYEMAANYLFAPNFDDSPASFTYDASDNDVSIGWNKEDFLNTTDSNIVSDVKADLYFYLRDIQYDNQSISYTDASSFKPLILHNLETSGLVNITGLESGLTYESYINFSHNGWVRQSSRREILTGITAILTIDPSDFGELSSDASTFFSDVSSNVSWTAEKTFGSTWITIIPDSSDVGSGPGGNEVMSISVTENSGIKKRTGLITVSSAAPDKTISFSQLPPVAVNSTISMKMTWNGDATYMGGNVKLRLDDGTPGTLIDTKNIAIAEYPYGATVGFDGSVGVDYYIDFSSMWLYDSGSDPLGPMQVVFTYDDTDNWDDTWAGNTTINHPFTLGSTNESWFGNLEGIVP